MAEELHEIGEDDLTLDVVFKTITGNYESITETDISGNSGCKFVCFTDNPNLKSETWEVRQITPKVPGNSIRSSRAIKMLGHQQFPKGTRSLYVDNSVKLTVDPTRILDEWLSSGPLTFMHHSTRNMVRDEFWICSAYGLDDQEKIYGQYKYYKENFPEILKQKPFWGGMIARVSNDSVDTFMEEWFSQYMRFSRRDQLGINATAAITGIDISAIEGRNDISPWHEWPIISDRKLEGRESVGRSIFRKPKIVLNGLRYYRRFH